ncbi:PREDICTED: uncharacterized protein C7orf26 homolog [Nicrophorus vespilloides]|uniref:Uncharacterized protein C7orf26 homolog n=1 Tax=Nicrophorus vespilloides TaxID=110193 RepID=A0ABM1MNA0_NICVS|nr:PREDICTED: uncharacterized protein C7orf26 homolog [Nicrophorus vespilloides]
MSSSEIKQGLRKTEFPNCAKEALNKIGQLICGRNTNIKQMDLALDLMAEFVFCEVDRRGNKRNSVFTAIQELQLLEVLFDYFNSVTGDAARNSVFLTLFSGTTASQRLGILSKLVSIAIGTGSAKVLISASTWMQQLGNTSPNCCKLAEALVMDYFILIPNSIDQLKLLYQNSQQFTANFLTAVAELYYVDSKKEIVFPPKTLLETIVHWVSENYKLCVAAQIMQSPLPPGAIAMEATTPIAGLLKWCVLAPIYNQNNELYSQLHLSLLNSLLEIPVSNPPRAVSSQHLIVPVGSICRYSLELHKRKKGVDKQTLFENDANLQLSLDRYAQAIQIALFGKCIYGNVNELVNQLSQLPQNKLLGIVIYIHKMNK